MFIDVHCHLGMLEDEGCIIEKALREAMKKGVEVIVTNGVRPDSNRRALEFLDRYEGVEACLGIYPTDALDMDDDEIGSEIGFIRKNKNKIAGIGEIGLDFKETESKEEREKQEKVFRKLVKLAIDLKLPMTVHSRKAEESCIEILEELGARKVIMHYFSGKLQLVEKIIDNGWYLTIPTAVKNSQHFQKIIELANLKNLFCETDSPYSHPDRKFPNTPENVIVAYEKIAEIKGLSLKEVESQIEKNFEFLFGKR